MHFHHGGLFIYLLVILAVTVIIVSLVGSGKKS